MKPRPNPPAGLSKPSPLEELRAGRITKVELRQMLGLARIELDGFLKSHNIYQDYTLEDFEEERQALKDLVL